MKRFPLKVTLQNSWKANCLFLLAFFCTSIAQAQLKADFSVDKTTGCSPLSVFFTNKTSGASANAKYSWDFGNGNTSTLENPGATYRTEKTYTVTLTVVDGTQTATKTGTITVYKKPVVSFSLSENRGCLPLQVKFSSQSTPGDGTITNYFWDFGDGTVVSGLNSKENTHTFTFAQKATVSLSVTNSFGCVTTVEKPEAVEVLQNVKAAFNVDKRIVCVVGDLVKFQNNSTGPGILSYLWKFGDGKTSTEKNPIHLYEEKGIYTVTLEVKSSEGCSGSIVQNNFINVANFFTDFEVPAAICKGAPAIFKEKNTPKPDSVFWEFSDGGKLRSTTTGTVSYTFKTAGTYRVKCIAFYGKCSETKIKEVVVHDAPILKGFLSENNSTCGAPALYSFKDTTSTAVQWKWTFPQSKTANTQSASYTFTSNGTHSVVLTVTNAAGCSVATTKAIKVEKPTVSIKYISSTSPHGNSGCTGLKMKFEAVSSEELIEYKWDFGDGGTSVLPKPEHTFNVTGEFKVKLKYTTKSGCKDSALYSTVYTYRKPVIDFRAFTTTICGNTPLAFIATADTITRQWYWSLGNNDTALFTTIPNLDYQYFKEGVYTVSLYANNNTCRSDTVTKVDYIKVLPPFPLISGVMNSCEGDRATVRFKHETQKAETITWDFGDGTTMKSNSLEVKHTYKQSGAYKVTLTATNGQCTVRDSISAFVLKKQSPVLTVQSNEICSNDSLKISISGFERNPFLAATKNVSHYKLNAIQYGDGSLFNGKSIYKGDSAYWTTVYKGILANLNANKEDLRIITRSEYFGCFDTTNIVPLKVNGPTALFSVPNTTVCNDMPVLFQDLSKGTIKKWEWSFGDSTSKINTTQQNETHTYAVPGVYTTILKVTDEKGCTSTFSNASNKVVVSGPKAAFTTPSDEVAINTKVDFSNKTVRGNTDASNISYLWIYDKGKKATTVNLSHTYKAFGVDTVTLIATNKITKCIDTATLVIYIKNLNASFTYTASYINHNSCPPVLAKFVNTSKNARKAIWDFGDGSMAEGQNTPEHTYKKAGVYKVTLYTIGANGLKDSASEYITVQGPKANIKADKLFGCLKQKVTLSAEVMNASNYYWDFGDGTVQHTKDTFSVHHYMTAGVYTPALVMSDSTGCSVAAEMEERIVIDSLKAGIKRTPLVICDSGIVSFQPDLVSVAVERMGKELAYQWNFGTGKIGDTSILKNPDFYYKAPGTYQVKLTAVSPYGCTDETVTSLTVVKKVKGEVSGTSEICAGGTAQFSASVPQSTGTSWKWVFPEGDTSSLLKPQSRIIADSGFYTARFLVHFNGCTDTAVKKVWVHGNPKVILKNRNESICLNKSVQLFAGGGSAYSWTPSTSIVNGNSASPTVAPRINTTYIVKVTNDFGCTSNDSVKVTVHQPFKLKVAKDTFVCVGGNVLLRAEGAASYLWEDVTGTLINRNSATPIANPKVGTTYTVIGSDAVNCFKDTARVAVQIKQPPTVSLGPDLELTTGSDHKLEPKGSSDITGWSWTPKENLSCSNCPAPIASPRKSGAVMVTVQNKFGCTASDTMNIKLVCSDSKIFIPNAFTPNFDGKNETFYINGKGIQEVISFRIFSRWGDILFEKRNYQVNDQRSGWDGFSKGQPVPVGTYPYIAEMRCDTGEIIIKKGTVTVVL